MNLANHTISGEAKSLSCKGRGHLLEFSAWNGNAATRYLMLFDSKELPPNGTKPRRQWTITTEQTFDGVFPHGRPFKTGLILAMSSTKNTLTLVAEEDAILEATFQVP